MKLYSNDFPQSNANWPLTPTLTCISLALILTACGGGGGNNNDSADDGTTLVGNFNDGDGNDGADGGDGSDGADGGNSGNVDATDGDGGGTSGGGETDGAYAFDVTITNSMASQPLSPMALIIHNDNYDLFLLGESASVPLEELAEGGSNTALLAEAANDSSVLETASGEGELLPGNSATYRIGYTPSSQETIYLAGVTMLVNTNDAIAAWQRIPISTLQVEETRRFVALTYDTGTELNTETAATIPGPVAGGEGYAEERDDITDAVLIHPGVVTADDGLETSALGNIYKWDNPAVSVRVTRVR